MKLLFFLIFFIPSSFACSCLVRDGSKDYQSIQKKFYGKKFNYSCVYDCQSRGFKEEVKAFYQKRIFGEERGNEIVCEGTIYQEQYSSHRGWFIYVYKGKESFSAKKSKSSELKEWSERHCR